MDLNILVGKLNMLIASGEINWDDIIIRGVVTIITTAIGAGLAFWFNRRNQKRQNRFMMLNEAKQTLIKAYVEYKQDLTEIVKICDEIGACLNEHYVKNNYNDAYKLNLELSGFSPKVRYQYEIVSSYIVLFENDVEILKHLKDLKKHVYKTNILITNLTNHVIFMYNMAVEEEEPVSRKQSDKLRELIDEVSLKFGFGTKELINEISKKIRDNKY